MVIAPESQQSAVGHGITLHKPLRLDPVDLGPDIEAYSTNGTPADCVILGTLGDLPCPDIVVSGINAGANLGEEVLYSGTVSAALEAALHDVPGVAISVCAYEDVLFDAAAALAPSIVEALVDHPLGCGTILNVNVPNIEPERIEGLQMTRLGRRKYDDVVIRREDPRGRPYYWFSGGPTEADSAPGTDIHAIQQNLVSMTLVHFDLTSEQRWEGFEALAAAEASAIGPAHT
jgi:5'-nucleotidase